MSRKYICLFCAAALCLTLLVCGKKKTVIDPTEIITLPPPTETEAPTNPK